jgi:hypothetical protein
LKRLDPAEKPLDPLPEGQRLDRGQADEVADVGTRHEGAIPRSREQDDARSRVCLEGVA